MQQVVRVCVCVVGIIRICMLCTYVHMRLKYSLLLQAPPLAPPRPTMKLNSGTSLLPHKMSAPGNFTNHLVSTAIKTEPAQGR